MGQDDQSVGEGPRLKGGGDEKNLEGKVLVRETCALALPLDSTGHLLLFLMFSVRSLWPCARTEREKAYV